MEFILAYKIPELAQEFMKSPKIERRGKVVVLLFDYESETGEYKWTGITFANTIAYKHTSDICISQYMLNAYNAVVEIENSKWLNEINLKNVETYERYKHYIVYFDGFGAYEFISKGFSKGIKD